MSSSLAGGEDYFFVQFLLQYTQTKNIPKYFINSERYCYRIGLLVFERVKLKKCVSVLQNDGVKKLVGPVDILKRPTYFFLLHTTH